MTQAAAKSPYSGAGAHLDRPDEHQRETYGISDLTAEFEAPPGIAGSLPQ